MVIPNRWIALAFRTVAVVLITIGIVRVTGLLSPEPAWRAFLFYTVQSNLLCLGWMVANVVRTSRDLAAHGPHGTSTPSARFAGAVMEAITVTMLIYLVVLVPALYAQPGAGAPFTLTDDLIHIVTPILLIADWLLFVPKGHLRWVDPLLWTLIPYAYLAFAFSYGALGGTFIGTSRYPYPFMNLEENGLDGVVRWIAGLSVALVAVGYIYVAADRALAALASTRSRERVAASA